MVAIKEHSCYNIRKADTYKEETKTGDLLLHLQIMSFTPTEHFQKELCDDEHQYFIHINDKILPSKISLYFCLHTLSHSTKGCKQ